MTELQHSASHVADGLARLLTSWKDKPKMVAFVRIILERVQHIEDVYRDIYTLSWLETAEGLQLDNLGAIVDEARKGRADALYRPWIKARVLVNRANGLQSDLLRVLRLIIGDAPTVTYTRVPPAAFTIAIAGVPSSGDVAKTVHGLLSEVKGAGIRMDLRYTDSEAVAFKFAPNSTPDTLDTVHGFGNSITPTTGGHFAGVI